MLEDEKENRSKRKSGALDKFGPGGEWVRSRTATSASNGWILCLPDKRSSRRKAHTLPTSVSTSRNKKWISHRPSSKGWKICPSFQRRIGFAPCKTSIANGWSTSMMLVKILEFGSNWWARFGRDPHDHYRYTRHAAYFNSTGVRSRNKMRRYWVVPGLIRFNGEGDFHPQFPNRAVGEIFECGDLVFARGGNRVLFQRKVAKTCRPDYFLSVVSNDRFGALRFEGSDRSIPDSYRCEPCRRRTGSNVAHAGRRLGQKRARRLATHGCAKSAARRLPANARKRSSRLKVIDYALRQRRLGHQSGA